MTFRNRATYIFQGIDQEHEHCRCYEFAEELAGSGL